MSRLQLYRPSALEVAAGWVAGTVPDMAEIAPVTGRDPLDVLIEIVTPALERSPCIVTFSGGRDSSAVLAVATLAARRAGLPLPVAVTDVFPELPDADERSWQEEVIRHLGVTDWERMEFRDEVDVIGPVAQKGLVAHGVTWPASFHTRTLLFEVARGGAILTGNGGDEVFGSHRISPVTRRLSRRVPRSAAPLKDVARALAPAPIRRAMHRRDMVDDLHRPWLTPVAIKRERELELVDLVALPLTYRASVLHLHRRKGWQVAKANFDQLAAMFDVRYEHPLLAPAFLQAMGAAGGRRGYITRTYGMRAVFGDLLPDALIRRTSKAAFHGAMVNRYALAFAEQWDGTGVDPGLVVSEPLRREWQSSRPHGGSLLLLQAAWLAAQGLPTGTNGSPTDDAA